MLNQPCGRADAGIIRKTEELDGAALFVRIPLAAGDGSGAVIAAAVRSRVFESEAPAATWSSAGFSGTEFFDHDSGHGHASSRQVAKLATAPDGEACADGYEDQQDP